jgi:uncharacterized repeat protein (TIGR01451 family)
VRHGAERVAPQDLTISKTANPTYMRAFDWTVAKSVDKTTVTTDANTATFNYTVAVTKGPGIDSGWKVFGQVTLTNPNPFPVLNANVTDAISNGGACTVTNGTGVTVPANGNVVLNYECLYAAAPTSAAGTNVATVEYDSYCPPSAADCVVTRKTLATGPVAFAFGAPAAILHDSVSVQDIFDGTPVLLSGSINASQTFTYAREVPVPATGCHVKNNTAVITATDDAGYTRNSAASVQTCREAGGVQPTGKPERTSINVSKGANKDVVRGGKNVKFTIRFKVTGKAAAVDVKVCDKLPSAMVFVSAPGATFQKGQACWLRKSVKPGTTLVFRVTAKVDANVGVGTACNNVVATASNAATDRAKRCVRVLPQAGRVGGGTVGVTG